MSLPVDYESCGDCGFDHEYEPTDAHAWHSANPGSYGEPMTAKLDTFTRAYIECALWSSNDWSRDDGGDPLDKNYSADDIAPETLAKIVEDCALFQVACADYIGAESELAGHDFWLTRNGHGSGFWDGDWPEPEASLMSQASEAFGNIDLYVGDDGKIYSA